MIFDRIENIGLYAALVPQTDKIAEFYATSDGLAPGRYELGEGSYVLVIEGTTRPAGEVDFEAHRAFMDVQVVAGGAEAVGWQVLDRLVTKVAYDPAKDIEFFDGVGPVTAMEQGMFYVVKPTDGHQPCVDPGDAPADFRKVVFKIKL